MDFQDLLRRMMKDVVVERKQIKQTQELENTMELVQKLVIDKGLLREQPIR